MVHFSGIECPVCHRPFADGDDIVVCPDCGTPHHRSCWNENGGCANAALHGTGFAFEMPAQNATYPCPNCGAACTEDLLYCENCGASLKAGEETALTPDGEYVDAQAAFQKEMAEDIDGLPVQDWANFIGPSAPYYIFQFKRMDAMGRTTSFSWSAVMFAPFYFWYRKMWKIGLIAAVSNILLNLPSLFINLNYYYGVALPFAASTMNTLYMVSIPLVFGLNMMWGMTAYNRYRKFAAEKIRAVRAKVTVDDERGPALAKAGGVSRVVLICAALLLGAYFITSLL